MPAADLSEQISTAGMEASGTGNMKLALNGALTIGTLDGANIEIREHVGAENVIIFGLTAEEVAERQRAGFTGAMAVEGSPRFAAVLESLRNGTFSRDDPGRFVPIVESLLAFDRFMVAADFEAYWKAQRAVDALWRSPAGLVAHGDPEHGAHGLVLVRPRDPRIRAGNLARAGGVNTFPLTPRKSGRAARHKPENFATGFPLTRE